MIFEINFYDYIRMLLLCSIIATLSLHMFVNWQTVLVILDQLLLSLGLFSWVSLGSGPSFLEDFHCPLSVWIFHIE